MRRGFIIGGVSVAVLAAAGAGFWFYRAHTAKVSNVESAGGSVSLSSNATAADQKATELKVAGSDTGQLSAGGNALLGNNPGNASGGGSDGSSGSAPKSITPQDFKQFDQYKTAQNAMYVDMKAGDGAEAAAGKTLSVNYRGWLTDGREFDESYAKGKPFSFVLGQHQVILGWEEGTAGMKVGGQRLVIVPPVVGYGSQGHDPIPPDVVLVFAIELVGAQ